MISLLFAAVKSALLGHTLFTDISCFGWDIHNTNYEVQTYLYNAASKAKVHIHIMVTRAQKKLPVVSGELAYTWYTKLIKHDLCS